MHSFVETISVVGAIAIVIVGTIFALTLFFKAIAWLSAKGTTSETIAVRGVLAETTFATVQLASGQTFDRVRFLGFTNSESVKTHIPYELNGMVILEDEKQQRYLVRARDIRMIVVPPEAG
jgi:hypothetical protein